MTRVSTPDRVAPRLVAASSTSAIEILNDRLQGADHERQADEDEREVITPSRVKATLHAVGLEQPAHPAVRRIDRRQRDAGDRRRQRKRQIDQRIDESPARETDTAPAPTRRSIRTRALMLAATSDAPMLSRYDATTRGSVIVSRRPPTSSWRARRQRQQRHEDDEAQVGRRESHRQPEPGQDAAAR